MNASRVAALLRELADALEEGEPEAEPCAPREVKPRRRVREYPAPLKPVSETDMIAAQRMLRRRGMLPP